MQKKEILLSLAVLRKQKRPPTPSSVNYPPVPPVIGWQTARDTSSHAPLPRKASALVWGRAEPAAAGDPRLLPFSAEEGSVRGGPPSYVHTGTEVEISGAGAHIS